VETDTRAVQALLQGKRVLVTGGGGSIGSELCRQILHCRPAQLVLLGHGENSIFSVSQELQRQLQVGGLQTELAPVVADIRFAERMTSIFGQYRPQVVFHTAAHKHVPLMELNPAEAITNNVLGTQNVLRASLAHDVEHFVFVSTDKAVNPTSIMGASKRMAELLVLQAGALSNRSYSVVRFGNVLGSRGSVILTFKQQIAAGGPVTITDPDMTRYFMTIPEAVQLVLQAAELGSGGEIFVLDMGEPVRIMDLAQDLIELSGLEVGRDIDIRIEGRRPGETLHEELFVAGQDYERTSHGMIFTAANSAYEPMPQLAEQMSALAAAARRNDGVAIRRLLKSFIPEYEPAEFGPAQPTAVSPGTDRVVGQPAVEHGPVVQH
jgi:FlaA1/EpsC-like NDP-sugar epimerase